MTHSPCEQLESCLLDVRERAALAPPLQAHLCACAGCRALADTHFGLYARMAAIDPVPSAAAWDAIAARIAAPAPSLAERFIDWLRGLGAPGLALAAAAVAVALLVVLPRGGLQVAYRAGGRLTLADGRALSVTGSLPVDGARLALAPDSWLEVQFGPGSSMRLEGPATCLLDNLRRVRMTGGLARFDLAPHPDGFVVDVPGGEVRVIGTIFAVHDRAEGARVTVERGVVEVRPRGAAARRLQAGGSALLLATGTLGAEPAPSSSSSPAASPSPAAVWVPSATVWSTPSASTAPASPPPSLRPVRPGRRTEGGF